MENPRLGVSAGFTNYAVPVILITCIVAMSMLIKREWSKASLELEQWEKKTTGATDAESQSLLGDAAAGNMHKSQHVPKID